MMAKYMETKKEYEDCILFYRLGDFYEMFFDDAITASRELEITLTGKSCGLEERAPMCGVPYHAAETYLTRLVNKGYKVAICEQVEDPKLAKGLVKREVTKVVTPGTNLVVENLDSTKNNYLMCIFYLDKNAGVCVADLTTSDFYLTDIAGNAKLFDEIVRYAPSEIICNENLYVSDLNIKDITEKHNISTRCLDYKYFDQDECTKRVLQQFKSTSLKNLGVDCFDLGIIAAGALIKYLHETQKSELNNLNYIKPYRTDKFMLLDSSTRRNLELCETMRDKEKRGTLLWVLDKTKTAMGGRQLRHIIEQPLCDKTEIERRLDCIEDLNNEPASRDEIREYLAPVYDLERLLCKITYKTVNPRDMISFCSSLKMIPPVKKVLSGYKSALLKELYDNIDSLEDISTLIENAILEEPPLTIREGGIIKDGFDPDIDTLRSAHTDGKKWLAQLESDERERTGIKNLKIKYNKVFGYYFEVTNSYKDLVPDDFFIKQTLANAERYTSVKLKEYEDKILNAEEKLKTLEYDMFCEIRDAIQAECIRIQDTARAIAYLDAYASLGLVAEQNNFVRPKLNSKGVIKIKDGRHPVVEKMLSGNLFIPNDTTLDNAHNCISIITGPNMAGKSTYMRQTALIVLMAQIGSFVPASSADIGIVDRIFTRVGASDDLASGQSTFMVEMNEVANILRNATSNSLLILDEIGRGTSTFDGLAIAWAVIEHISNKKLLGAKTLFATHYHELTELEGKMDNVKNYCVAVKESGDDIVFLRKIIKGGADKSYGIQVAKIAGVPEMVIDRAKVIAEELTYNDITQNLHNIAPVKGANEKAKHRVAKQDDVDAGQMSLYDLVKDEDIINEIRDIELSVLTPLDALNTLYRLQNKIKNRWNG
ncbi:MAG: DNA mismatch repair protein MutS [Lachnospiraceae bacterium]|nr:DNA mismatch repair protein MutS [Lachnospiraceae bacterium]